MSFALTTEQVRNRTKTVTRRVGWKFAKPGMVVQPIVKGQGLKKGEKVQKVGGPIRFVRVERDRIWSSSLTPEDIAREGFPGMDRRSFYDMFIKHNGRGDGTCTRIEFEYVAPSGDQGADTGSTGK